MLSVHTKCRVCGGSNLQPYLYLGQMPLSNNLADSSMEALAADRYSLQVVFCTNCYLSQLSVVIDPETLFGHYVYRSSINKGYVDHCRQMAKTLKLRHGLNAGSFMIDIAGNDGALLKEFKDEIGLKVLNVDPAKNLVPINDALDIKMFNTFWGLGAAHHLLDVHFPKADLITATNVFAHVDNPLEFLQACKLVLKDDGVIVLEFPYLIDFIEKNEFDTIYFEHLSYFSVTPLMHLCQKAGLHIFNVEKQEIHGGSLRVSICKAPITDFTNGHYYSWVMQENAAKYNQLETYKAFADNVKDTVRKFRQAVLSLRAQEYKVAAFAASAKGNTLLNCAGINIGVVNYIVDETPEKLGKYSPGTGIPIVSMDRLQTDPPDYLIILSWNFQEEIIEKVSKVYGGKYIIPIPEFKIL